VDPSFDTGPQASHARDWARPFESPKPVAATLMGLHCFAMASELCIAKPAANNAMTIGTLFIVKTRLYEINS